jgi:hypothetical protein
VSAREGSSSFLKKRTKKLLSVSGATEFTRLAPRRRATDKSFLVLFFKKELLACLPVYVRIYPLGDIAA